MKKQALEWNPEGKRKRGRPRHTWRRGVEAELRSEGHSWRTLKSWRENVLSMAYAPLWSEKAKKER